MEETAPLPTPKRSSKMEPAADLDAPPSSLPPPPADDPPSPPEWLRHGYVFSPFILMTFQPQELDAS